MKINLLPLLFLLGIVVAALSPIEAAQLHISKWVFIIGGLIISLFSFILLLLKVGSDN